ncbi:hypothetical protein NVP1052A_25 [Vibrio phage 1.052.A._10N.286.46.C3]|nr:hypothetical protein NVP1052A_25 [Vibrio phage 1.052.A._10N.286.46.C3]
MSTVQTENIKGLTGGLPQNLKPVTASAWVHFDGTTLSIADSHNVSSITDKGVGDYGLNYLVNLQNANYSVVSNPGTLANRGLNSRNRTVSGVDAIAFITNTGVFIDVTEANVLVFGGNS